MFSWHARIHKCMYLYVYIYDENDGEGWRWRWWWKAVSDGSALLLPYTIVQVAQKKRRKRIKKSAALMPSAIFRYIYNVLCMLCGARLDKYIYIYMAIFALFRPGLSFIFKLQGQTDGRASGPQLKE